MLSKLADLCGVTLEFNHETIDLVGNTAEVNENLRSMAKDAKAINRETRKGERAYQK